jgi:hypothetical protein
MPTEPDDKQSTDAEPFKGVRQYVENNDVAGLMRELDKVPTDTKEAILNKLSISDGNGGRIELDGNQMILMPEPIRKQAEEQLKKKHQSEQGDAS